MAEPNSEPQADSHDELLGASVGKYTLTRLIGTGGMGRVYEGVHNSLGKRAALKFIDKESVTEEAVERFLREAQAASAIESAHIVEVHDIGTTEDGRHFIVMELMRGEDLGHRIRRLGRLEVPEALRIAAQVLRGLARAHEAGIVHRDLKPDNVFLVERDDDPCFAKILDFGISKIQRRGDGVKATTITREGVVMGTPVYMSPEQAQAMSDLDQRTDLYSVGAILFECLTGRPPHSGASYEQVIVKICTKDADDVRLHNPLVSEQLACVLQRAMSRDREARYQSAREMLDALVSESEGMLPISLGSEGLKRAVIRTPAPGGSDRTLAAVSTVAVAPTPAHAAQPARIPRAALLVGAGFVAIGGIAAGVLMGRSPNPTAKDAVAGGVPPGLTVVVVSASAPGASDELPQLEPSAITAVEEQAPSPSSDSSAEPVASSSTALAASPSHPQVAPRSKPSGGKNPAGGNPNNHDKPPIELQLKLK